MGQYDIRTVRALLTVLKTSSKLLQYYELPEDITEVLRFVQHSTDAIAALEDKKWRGLKRRVGVPTITEEFPKLIEPILYLIKHINDERESVGKGRINFLKEAIKDAQREEEKRHKATSQQQGIPPDQEIQD